MADVPGLLLDSNVWVSLAFASHPFHNRAGEQLTNSSANLPVCRIRATELSAFRLITTAAVSIRGGLHFVTLDSDFKRFRPDGLTLPLVR